LKGLKLENVGSEAPKTDNRGRLEVNAKFQTSVPHIHAIGDCIPGPMLAHKVHTDNNFLCQDHFAALHMNGDSFVCND